MFGNKVSKEHTEEMLIKSFNWKLAGLIVHFYLKLSIFLVVHTTQHTRYNIIDSGIARVCTIPEYAQYPGVHYNHVTMVCLHILP